MPNNVFAGRAGRLTVALALVAGLACDGTRGPAVTVSDSAGVTIVHSHRPSGSGLAWTVGPAPALTIDGPVPGMGFGRIVGVALLDGGGVVVAEGMDASIHFFSSDGTLVRAIRPGDLPVPQQALTGIYRMGEEVRVRQRGTAPTLVFDQEGRYLRSIEPPPAEGFQFIAQYQPMPDGALLAIQPPTGLLPRGREWTGNAQFVRIDGNGAEQVLSLPAVRFARLPGAVEAVVYGPVLGFAFTPDGVWAGYPDRFDIGLYGPDGSLRRRIRRDWEPTPVSTAMADSVRQRLTRIMEEAGIPDDPELREQPESQIRELRIAETLPAFGRILLDREGRLWVEHVPPAPIVISGPFPTRAVPTPWDLFDSEGAWLGTVATPADTHVMDIDATAVAGILRTGTVDRAVVYPIERDPGRD